MKRKICTILLCFLIFLPIIGCRSERQSESAVKVPKSAKVYDKDGKLVESIEFDEKGNKVKTVAESAGSMAFDNTSYYCLLQYDDQGRVLEEAYYDNQDALYLKVTVSYNSEGDILKRIEERTGEALRKQEYEYQYENGKTVFSSVSTYSGDSLEMKEENTYAFDDKGNAKRVTEVTRYVKQGRESRKYLVYEYSYQGNQITKTVCTVYGSPSEEEKNIQSVSVAEYDSEGRVVLEKNTRGEALSEETTYTYNEYGLLETKTEFLGEIRKYTYTYW